MKIDIGMLNENRKFFGMSQEQFSAVIDAAECANQSPLAQKILDRSVAELKNDADLQSDFADIYNGAPGMQVVLSLLVHFPALKDKYSAYGIPDNVLIDTVSDIPIWMNHCMRFTGKWGMVDIGWLKNHFSFQLFRLGRIQFKAAPSAINARVYKSGTGSVIALAPEGMKYNALGEADGTNGVFDESAWTASVTETEDSISGYPILRNGLAQRACVTLKKSDWSIALLPGDSILEMHIPEGEPLNPQAVRQSIEIAPAFYNEYLNVSGIKAFTCISWLLDWAFAEMRSGSNIAAFHKMMYCVPAVDDDSAMHERVFGYHIDNWCQAPTDTALRRAVKDWYTQSRLCRGAQGFILLNGDA